MFFSIAQQMIFIGRSLLVPEIDVQIRSYFVMTEENVIVAHDTANYE